MAGETNGNGNGGAQKLIWWVIGVQGAAIALFAITMLNKIDMMDRRIGANEVAIATTKEVLSQLGELTRAIRQEQIDRTFRFGELNTKISNLELSMKLTEDRYKTISERILTINQRLDNRPPTPPVPTP